MIKNKILFGFTLIEIMMVLFIFMIMISFAAINTNFQFNETTKLHNLANNLVAKIKLAKQEAILQHATLKLTIENNSYGFQKLKKTDKTTRWDWIKSDSLLENVKIDKNIIMKTNNNLVFYPNGVFEPFQILISSTQKNTNDIIYGDKDGNIGIIKNAN